MVCIYSINLYYHVYLKNRMLPFYSLYLFNNSIIMYTSKTGCYLSMVCIYSITLLSRIPQTLDVTFQWFVFITTLYYHVYLKHRMLPLYGLYLLLLSILTYTSNTGCFTFLWFMFIDYLLMFPTDGRFVDTIFLNTILPTKSLAVVYE